MSEGKRGRQPVNHDQFKFNKGVTRILGAVHSKDIFSLKLDNMKTLNTAIYVKFKRTYGNSALASGLFGLLLGLVNLEIFF